MLHTIRERCHCECLPSHYGQEHKKKLILTRMRENIIRLVAIALNSEATTTKIFVALRGQGSLCSSLWSKLRANQFLPLSDIS